MPFLLQAAEATKAAAAAAAVVGEHTAKDPVQSLLWLLVLLLGIAGTLLGILLFRSEVGRAGAIQKAVDEARASWQKQHEEDNARLERINVELRQQEKKSVEVIAAVTQAIAGNTTALQGLQFQFVTFETVLTGRAAQAPARLPSPPQL